MHTSFLRGFQNEKKTETPIIPLESREIGRPKQSKEPAYRRRTLDFSNSPVPLAKSKKMNADEVFDVSLSRQRVEMSHKRKNRNSLFANTSSPSIDLLSDDEPCLEGTVVSRMKTEEHKTYKIEKSFCHGKTLARLKDSSLYWNERDCTLNVNTVKNNSIKISKNNLIHVKYHFVSHPRVLVVYFASYPREFLDYCEEGNHSCEPLVFQLGTHLATNKLVAHLEANVPTVDIIGYSDALHFTTTEQQRIEQKSILRSDRPNILDSKPKKRILIRKSDCGASSMYRPMSTRSGKQFQTISTAFESADPEVVVIESDDEKEKEPTTELFRYPFNAKNSYTVYTKDLQRLSPATFLNDTIINFYIRYLVECNKDQLGDTVHIFSSFFYKNLSVGYEKVQKWTKNVNIFEKNIIYFPVNERFHWYSVIILNPGKCLEEVDLIVESDSETQDSPYKRISLDPNITHILFLDSLGFSQRNTVARRLKEYLIEEARTKYSKTAENAKIKHSFLKVPRQDNLHDCGLFVLEYAESFFGSYHMSIASLMKNGKIAFRDWFNIDEVKQKRHKLLSTMLMLAREYNEFRRKRGELITQVDEEDFVRITREIEQDLEESVDCLDGDDNAQKEELSVSNEEPESGKT